MSRIAGVLPLAVLLPLAAWSAPGDTDWVSVRSLAPTSMTYTHPKAVSADGRYVVFYGEEDIYVGGDANGSIDCVLRDRLAGKSYLVSVSSGGAQANRNSCWYADMTPDGRYVAFDSQASNLVPNDTNGFPDIFVRDVQAGTTERVSLGENGAQMGNWQQHASISDDGRYVAFSSAGTVYVRDRLNRLTKKVVSPYTLTGNPRISGDGRFLLYGNNGRVYVQNLVTGARERVDRQADGQFPTEGGYPAGISRDGRYVLLDTAAALVPGDWNGYRDAYVRDRLLGTTRLASVKPDGSLFFAGGSSPALSADGRFVTFAGNRPGAAQINDVYVRDMATATTVDANRNSSGTLANGSGALPVLSADGRYVAFYSEASNLSTQDADAFGDTYLRELGVTATVSFKVSPRSLAFGDVTVGSRSSVLIVTVSNTGTAPVSFSWIGIAGADSGEFVRTRHCPGTLAVGATCTVDVQFVPTVAAPASARLVVSTGASGLKRSAALSGNGT